ncbi:P-loop containing nucleoside triphosphate hydrolase protein [Xylariaceae sp. FL0662B]|nr:P-loop containing nucleoside triphosphate hydrolase protein [Xylariaceae sp. FL0662B]
MDDLRLIFEYLMTPSSTIFIVGGLIVLLAPILVHFFIVHQTPYTSLPSIVLAGPPGAGKTALLTLLERGADRPVATHTSQTPQSVELTVSTDHKSGRPITTPYREAARDDAPGKHRKFLLIDTPGHGKLRAQALNHLFPGNGSGDAGAEKGAPNDRLRGVVFVVDAAALDDNLADAAAYLYEVLLALQRRTGAGRTSKTPNAVAVLVAANKADLFTALPASLVRGHLEAELGRIRQSRSKGLLDSGVGVDEVGAAEDQDVWLGQYGSDKFTFDQMREFDLEVDVVGGSILEAKVDKWWDWISSRI